MALASLSELKDHLKITHRDEDRDLGLKIDQATALVLLYLKRTDLGSPIDEDVREIVPSELTAIEQAVIQGAILKVAANLYRFRGDDPAGENPADEQFLTADLRGMLSMLRDPALA